MSGGYDAYCADVRRWVPRLGKFSQATKGMAFNVKRVIAKDYSTASATLITLLSAEIYQHAINTAGPDRRHLPTVAALIARTGCRHRMCQPPEEAGRFQ